MFCLGTFLKLEDYEGELSYIQGHLIFGKIYLFHGLKYGGLLEQDIVSLLPGFLDDSVQYCYCYEGVVYERCKNIGR
jgi:hypothetical protein